MIIQDGKERFDDIEGVTMFSVSEIRRRLVVRRPRAPNSRALHVTKNGFLVQLVAHFFN
jgi:hypothetical protein